jgi:hypothetical protein
MNGLINKIIDISQNAPEINMNNFTNDQVEQLNNAMIEIYGICIEYFAKSIKKENKLYQCPYNKATRCAMRMGCLGCEDFNPKEISHINKNGRSPYDLNRAGFNEYK